ncbi:MAG: tetratricopeptide repeat protein [Acidobacteriota bacterium]
MKRAERHHLKQNELERLTVEARRALTERTGATTGILVALLVVAVVGIGYYAWRANVQSRAHGLLAEAVATQEAPITTLGASAAAGSYANERARLQAAVAKFKAAADAYPSTDAGSYARYQEAVGQVTLGNLTGAATAYQEVIRTAGDGINGQMARLGLAEAQARSGQFDQAINAYKEMAQRKDGPLPVDGILMQLGRAYRDAGKRTDAQQTFNRLVQEFPDSPFLADAKRELDTLNRAPTA